MARRVPRQRAGFIKRRGSVARLCVCECTYGKVDKTSVAESGPIGIPIWSVIETDRNPRRPPFQLVINRVAEWIYWMFVALRSIRGRRFRAGLFGAVKIQIGHLEVPAEGSAPKKLCFLENSKAWTICE